MKKFIVVLGLLASVASPARAQDGRLGTRPASRPGRVSNGSSPRVSNSNSGTTIDLVGLTTGVVGTISLSRLLWAHPEVLLAPQEADYAPARRNVTTVRWGRPAGATARRTTASPPAARFGVKAGLNLSNIRGFGDEKKLESLVGLNAGLMAEFGFSEHLAFHPELLFSQKGAKYTETDGSGASFSEKERLSYLDLPLLLRAKASGFFVEAGPQLGYLLAQKSDFSEYVPGLGSYDTSSTDTDDTRRLDVGYVVGLGYQLPQGLEVGVRYNGGLADVQNPSSDPKLRNSVFQFQAGYLF